MTPEAQRIAIAEACGLGDFNTSMNGWHNEDILGLPDYLNDLNAMYQAENVLPDMDDDEGRDQLGYMEILADVVGARWTSNNQCDMWRLTHATAAQRAEAFLRTIGKWEASK